MTENVILPTVYNFSQIFTATNVKDPDLGEVSSYRELYTTLLHRYGGMIGLYQVIAGPFGGITEVRYSRSILEGISWDPATNTHNVSVFHSWLRIQASLYLKSPMVHAKAVWRDLQYEQSIFDFYLKELFRPNKLSIFIHPSFPPTRVPHGEPMRNHKGQVLLKRVSEGLYFGVC
ncbi:uncharacterized protein LOC134782053 isoform X2 [Penaeus indicus]|uniref:uncharacterized protein LOC134782053 isoform X2 n=1 Tax=Penaeus indicus TaxID=29960 RepID=UPI00300C550B